MHAVDTLFASCFTFAAAAAFVTLTIMTAQLPHIENIQTLKSSRISSKVIGVFFALMLIPIAYFTVKGLLWTAFSSLLLATVTSAALQRLSNRATLVLRKRHYI